MPCFAKAFQFDADIEFSKTGFGWLASLTGIVFIQSGCYNIACKCIWATEFA